MGNDLPLQAQLAREAVKLLDGPLPAFLRDIPEREDDGHYCCADCEG